jgi:hypothetical protein
MQNPSQQQERLLEATRKRLLEEFVGLVVEAKRVREADVSDGSRVPHGSSKHIRDLEARISSLLMWRNKQKRGTEARATYARLISRLKSELASARRAQNKGKR